MAATLPPDVSAALTVVQGGPGAVDQLVGAVAAAAAAQVFQQIGDPSRVLALSQRVDDLAKQIADVAAQAPVPGPPGFNGNDGADGAPGPPGPPGAPAGPIVVVL